MKLHPKAELTRVFFCYYLHGVVVGGLDPWPPSETLRSDQRVYSCYLISVQSQNDFDHFLGVNQACVSRVSSLCPCPLSQDEPQFIPSHQLNSPVQTWRLFFLCQSMTCKSPPEHRDKMGIDLCGDERDNNTDVSLLLLMEEHPGPEQHSEQD